MILLKYFLCLKFTKQLWHCWFKKVLIDNVILVGVQYQKAMTNIICGLVWPQIRTTSINVTFMKIKLTFREKVN